MINFEESYTSGLYIHDARMDEASLWESMYEKDLYVDNSYLKWPCFESKQRERSENNTYMHMDNDFDSFFSKEMDPGKVEKRLKSKDTEETHILKDQKNSSKKSRTKGLGKRRADAIRTYEKRDLPNFIKVELKSIRGEGLFAPRELLIMLLIACQVISQPNAYSLITLSMGTGRTRSSIRRKLEKIVLKKNGNDVPKQGGLLHNKESLSITKKIIAETFWETTSLEHEDMDSNEKVKHKAFVKKLTKYAKSRIGTGEPSG